MPEAISAEQWTKMRELIEGEPPTQESVARAADIYVKSVARPASRAGPSRME